MATPHRPATPPTTNTLAGGIVPGRGRSSGEDLGQRLRISTARHRRCGWGAQDVHRLRALVRGWSSSEKSEAPVPATAAATRAPPASAAMPTTARLRAGAPRPGRRRRRRPAPVAARDDVGAQGVLARADRRASSPRRRRRGSPTPRRHPPPPRPWPRRACGARHHRRGSPPLPRSPSRAPPRGPMDSGSAAPSGEGGGSSSDKSGGPGRGRSGGVAYRTGVRNTSAARGRPGVPVVPMNGHQPFRPLGERP